MSWSEEDLIARINSAKAKIETARQELAEARTVLSRVEVLKLLEKKPNKAVLEDMLISSGWYDVHGDHVDKEGVRKQRVIWTNPSETSNRGKEKGLNTSVRIMTDEDGSSYARVYNGPTGGDMRDINGNLLLDRQGKPIAAQALRLNENRTTAVTGNNAETHFPLEPDSATTLGANSFTDSPTAGAANTAENALPLGGSLRGADKFLGPAGHLLDAYSLYEAYDADGGFGENFRETAGGIAGGAAGGWGGAAAGAALGTAIFPGVGTVVGGIVGGIAGGFGGEKVGQFLGGLF